MKTGPIPTSRVRQMASGYTNGGFANASSSRFQSDTSADQQLAFGVLTNRVDQKARLQEERDKAFEHQAALLSQAAQRQAEEEASLALIEELTLQDRAPVVWAQPSRNADKIDSETLALLAQFAEEDQRARDVRLKL